MSRQLKEIQKILSSKANKSNEAFFEKMVPGKQKIYGVKTPELNLLAQQFKNYSFDLVKELWASGALEEKVIAIKISERIGKSDPRKVLSLFKGFSKTVDNWAVCDGLGMQFLRGIVKTHSNDIFDLSMQFSRSKNFRQRRLSLVMVEWYTRDSQFHPRIKSLVEDLENDEEYYVKKAVVWINRNLKKGK